MRKTKKAARLRQLARLAESREPRWKAPAPSTPRGSPAERAHRHLETTWANVLASYDARDFGRAHFMRLRVLDRLLDPRGSLGLTLTPLQAVTEAARAGLYPQPEVLEQIARAFEEYVAAAGALDLEEAFFGPRVRKAGNWSARHAAAQGQLATNVRIAAAHVVGKDKIRAAEQLAPKIEKQRKGRSTKANPTSLVAQYRRTGGAEVEKVVRGLARLRSDK